MNKEMASFGRPISEAIVGILLTAFGIWMSLDGSKSFPLRVVTIVWMALVAAVALIAFIDCPRLAARRKENPMRASRRRGLIAIPVLLLASAIAIALALPSFHAFTDAFAGKPWMSAMPLWLMITGVGLVMLSVTWGLVILTVDIITERNINLRWWIRALIVIAGLILSSAFVSPLVLAILIIKG